MRDVVRCVLLSTVIVSSVLTSGALAMTSTPVLNWGGITYQTHADGVTARYLLDVGLPLLPNTASLGGLTVQVSGPDGFSHTFTDADLSVWLGSSALSKEVESLAPGVYSFTVSDGNGHSATRTDLLANHHIMPVVDVGTLQRVRKNDGSYRFSWAPVGTDQPYYYRLGIFDVTGKVIYAGNRKFDAQDDVAAGVMTDGAGYQARVEVLDAPSFDLLGNRSISAYLPFTPSPSDYDPNRLPVSFAFVSNRTDSGGAQSFDANVSVGTFTGVGAPTITGPGYFSYTYDLNADKLVNNSQFYQNFTSAETGLYIFDIPVNGVHNYAYAALPPRMQLPAIDTSKMRARDLGNGSLRFSWADADHTGALYYRVYIRDSATNLFVSSGRVNRTYLDLQQSQFSSFSSPEWRVEVFDSSSGSTIRNRRNSSLIPLVVQPYDAAAPVMDYCQVAHVTNYDGSDLTFLYASARSNGGAVTELRIDGPNGFFRDMLGVGKTLLAGSPAAGSYTCSTTDSNGKTMVRYNYQPAAQTISPVDIRTVNVNTLPGGDLSLSWAPVDSDIPLWYVVELLQPTVEDGKPQFTTLQVPLSPAGFLQQTSVTIPVASLPQTPVLIRIYAYDGGDGTTFNNYSRSVAFGLQGAGFNYASLTDTDGNGFASNVPLTVGVQVTGSGGGSVYSVPAGIACVSGSTAGCGASFPGASATLTATPDSDSTFDGWQGACGNPSGDCTVTLNGGASVQAIFTKAPMVRLAGASVTTFPFIGDAYRSAAADDTIMSRAGGVTEDLVFDRQVTVKVRGGFDPYFTRVAGSTAVAGTMKIRSGTVRVEHLALHAKP